MHLINRSLLMLMNGRLIKNSKLESAKLSRMLSYRSRRVSSFSLLPCPALRGSGAPLHTGACYVHCSFQLWINTLEIKSGKFGAAKGSCYKVGNTCKQGNMRIQMAPVNLRLLDLPSISESSAGG